MNDNNVKISSKERATYGALSTTYEEGSWEDDGSVETGATCTVFETTCNLVSVLTGSGMLSLPYAAAQAGWSSLVILVVLCSIFLYSFELLATSIETFYTRENASLTRTKPISYYNIDYLSFGILSFGQYGDRIVLVIFGAEVSLALVSFLMNIGINIHVINPSISVSTGILISAGLTCIMSFWNLKTVALSSVVGLALTTLTVVAIFASGLHLHDEAMLATREYKMLNLTGVPVALGLIAFCFGGHGTFPRMYTTMTERHRYREVLYCTSAVVLLTYAVIMVAGYWFFAQYTLSPVTLNIGRDLYYHDTHYGLYWKVLAAFGIICNLQVTCPLVTFAIRDMTAKIINIHPSEGNQRLIVLAILCTVTPIALTLSGNFATVCSLIGSFATIANSVLLPMIFYHTVHHGRISAGKMVLHVVIVVIAVAATLVGIYANFSALLA